MPSHFRLTHSFFDDPVTIETDKDLIFLHGPHGSGKTSIIRAICGCLTSYFPEGRTKSQWQKITKNNVRQFSTSPGARADLTLEGETYDLFGNSQERLYMREIQDSLLNAQPLKARSWILQQFQDETERLLHDELCKVCTEEETIACLIHDGGQTETLTSYMEQVKQKLGEHKIKLTQMEDTINLGMGNLDKVELQSRLRRAEKFDHLQRSKCLALLKERRDLILQLEELDETPSSDDTPIIGTCGVENCGEPVRDSTSGTYCTKGHGGAPYTKTEPTTETTTCPTCGQDWERTSFSFSQIEDDPEASDDSLYSRIKQVEEELQLKYPHLIDTAHRHWRGTWKGWKRYPDPLTVEHDINQWRGCLEAMESRAAALAALPKVQARYRQLSDLYERLTQVQTSLTQAVTLHLSQAVNHYLGQLTTNRGPIGTFKFIIRSSDGTPTFKYGLLDDGGDFHLYLPNGVRQIVYFCLALAIAETDPELGVVTQLNDIAWSTYGERPLLAQWMAHLDRLDSLPCPLVLFHADPPPKIQIQNWHLVDLLANTEVEDEDPATPKIAMDVKFEQWATAFCDGILMKKEPRFTMKEAYSKWKLYCPSSDWARGKFKRQFARTTSHYKRTIEGRGRGQYHLLHK